MGSFGLHFHKPEAEGAFAYVSFVEAPRTWVCARIAAFGGDAAGDASGDAAGDEEAAVVSSKAIAQEVVAVCSGPSDGAIAVALATGAVRFMDAATGKLAGRGIRVEAPASGSWAGLVRLGEARVALVRGGGEFFVVRLNRSAGQCELELSGRMSAGSALAAPALLGAKPAGDPSAPERVLLRWGPGPPSPAGRATFASAVLSSGAPAVEPLPPCEEAGGPPALWFCADGYLVEWWPADPGSGSRSRQRIRDVRFGSTLAMEGLELFTGTSADVLVATAARTVLLASPGDHGAAAGVRLSLPELSLQGLLGRRAPRTARHRCEALAPLQDAISGKRPREAPEVAELFDAKRHRATDAALAAEVRLRRWAPGHELVNLVVQHGCPATAAAILTLPEVEDDIAVKLLAARPALLSHVVRRTCRSERLSEALRAHYPSAKLAGLLEVLLEWLQIYCQWPEAEVRSAMPSLPLVQELVDFLCALIDGCLPSIVALDTALLERATRLLREMRHETGRRDGLYSVVRATCRMGQMKWWDEQRMFEVMMLPL